MQDFSQVSGSSYDLSELRQALLSESNDSQPIKLTAGLENVLFHYVSLDATQGIIISPPECNENSKIYDTILDNFKKCCQSIRELFQNTIRFKVNQSKNNQISIHGLVGRYNAFEATIRHGSVEQMFSVWLISTRSAMPSQ